LCQIGVYSLSAPSLNLRELSSLMVCNGFSHLDVRGGSRGLDLTNRDPSTEARIELFGDIECDLGGLTSDWRLSDLMRLDLGADDDDLGRFRMWSMLLGFKWTRVLGDDPSNAVGDLVRRISVVPMLLEPHHPNWFGAEGLVRIRRLLEAGSIDGLLLDSEQIMLGVETHGMGALHGVSELVPFAGAVHLNSPVGRSDWVRQSDVLRMLASEAPSSVPVSIELSGGSRESMSVTSRLLKAKDEWCALTGRR